MEKICQFRLGYNPVLKKFDICGQSAEYKLMIDNPPLPLCELHAIHFETAGCYVESFEELVF